MNQFETLLIARHAEVASRLAVLLAGTPGSSSREEDRCPDEDEVAKLSRVVHAIDVVLRAEASERESAPTHLVMRLLGEHGPLNRAEVSALAEQARGMGRAQLSRRQVQNVLTSLKRQDRLVQLPDRRYAVAPPPVPPGTSAGWS